MDNLTHSLVGLFLARAGFRHGTERGAAIMVLAANAPDFDVVSWFGGNLTYLHWHRNITHSLLALPVMALLSVAIVRLLGRRPVRWLYGWAIALIAVASHLLLDLTNVYGVRLMLPFSGRWFHWDMTPVVDLALWAILLLGVAAPALGRLVGSEIGEKHPGKGDAGWAVVALLLFGVYDYGRAVLHDHAAAEVDSHVYNGLAPRRVGAFPGQNPLKWTGMAELSDSFVEIPVDLTGNYHSSDADTFYKPGRTQAVDAAIATRPFAVLLEFVQWPLWVVRSAPEVEGGRRVTLLDLRFSNPRRPSFSATATVDARNRVVESEFSLGTLRPR